MTRIFAVTSADVTGRDTSQHRKRHGAASGRNNIERRLSSGLIMWSQKEIYSEHRFSSIPAIVNQNSNGRKTDLVVFIRRQMRRIVRQSLKPISLWVIWIFASELADDSPKSTAKISGWVGGCPRSPHQSITRPQFQRPPIALQQQHLCRIRGSYGD